MFKRAIKVAIPGLLIGLLMWNIGKDWQTILYYWADFRILPFAIGFSFLLMDYPEGALAWHVILRKMGVQIHVWKSLRVWIVSTTTRYLPGSIWQYISRVELARGMGITRSETLISMMAEAFFALTAGLFLAGLVIPFISFERLNVNFWFLLLPALLLFLHPAIANQMIMFIGKFSKRKIKKMGVSLSLKDTVLIFPWFIVNFLINGLALFFLVLSLTGNLAPTQLLAFTGFYALSWVLGYIAFFAPAGVGITEVSLAYLLSFSMPLSLASAIALSYRFFLTIAELLVFLFVLRIKK